MDKRRNQKLKSEGGKQKARRPGYGPITWLWWQASCLPLEFGHFGSVNPKGCQKVAGGRRGFGGGDLRVTAQEKSCTPEGVPDSSLPSLLEISVAPEN